MSALADDSQVEQIRYVRPATVSKRALGEQAHLVEDHGPYYFFTPGEAIHRVDQKDSLPHIYPGLIGFCESWAKWNQPDFAAQTGIVSIRTVQDRDGRTHQELANAEYAGSIARDIADAYGPLGCINITAFQKKSDDEVQFERLNQLICPVHLAWHQDDIPPDTVDGRSDNKPAIRRMLAAIQEHEKEIKEIGVLEIRKQFVVGILNQLRAGSLPVPRYLVDMWREALEEIIASFGTYRLYANNRLNEVDAEIAEARGGNQDKKKAYDTHDQQMLWLLARRPIDKAAPVVVQNVIQQQPQMAPVVQAPAAPAPHPTIQCQECGNHCETINGNPPKKCWRCQAEFVQSGQTESVQVHPTRMSGLGMHDTSGDVMQMESPEKVVGGDVEITPENIDQILTGGNSSEKKTTRKKIG